MNMDNLGSLTATIGGGFFVGVLIGYALKKVVKIVAIVVGLFFAGIEYIQYQQIIDIKWNKLQSMSQDILATLANATSQVSGFGVESHTTALANLGIPLTGSMSMGFAIGFMKG